MASKKTINGTPESRREVIRAIESEQRTKKIVLWSVVGVVIAFVVFVIGFLVITAFLQDKPAEQVVDEKEYVVSYGANPDAKAQVDIYFDFMCPGCGTMEVNNAAELRQLADDGIAYLKFHPLSFLDRMSQGTNYSTRAANAFVSIAKAAPDKFMDFADLLWENQPEENSEGLSDEQIADYATSAGVPAEVVATLGNLEYKSWVEASTQNSFLADENFQSTPGVRINGKLVAGFGSNTPPFVDPYTPGVLGEAIKQAAK